MHYKTLDKVRGMTEIVKRFQGLVNINHVIGNTLPQRRRHDR